MSSPSRVRKPRAIALQGAASFRDLGGYPTRDGATTRYGVAYRSASLSDLTAHDQAVLGALGLAVCIDLRSGFEVAASGPDDLGDAGIRVVRLPVLDVEDGAAYADMLRVLLERPRPGGTDLGALYVHMLTESADVFARAFEIVAAEAPSVHHCTAGKDRTGLLSALLLRVAGVHDELIARDWSRSAPLPAPRLQQLRANLDRLLDDSDPDTATTDAQLPDPPPAPTPIEEALAFLDRTWGGAIGYLLAHGVDGRQIAGFRDLFVQRGKSSADFAVTSARSATPTLAY